jgi:hypothetical protein
MLVHAGSPKAFGVQGFSGETLEEERLSYLRSLQRHAAMEYGEIRSIVALKPDVGDYTPERFADHETRPIFGACSSSASMKRSSIIGRRSTAGILVITGQVLVSLRYRGKCLLRFHTMCDQGENGDDQATA